MAKIAQAPGPPGVGPRIKKLVPGCPAAGPRRRRGKKISEFRVPVRTWMSPYFDMSGQILRVNFSGEEKLTLKEHAKFWLQEALGPNMAWVRIWGSEFGI